MSVDDSVEASIARLSKSLDDWLRAHLSTLTGDDRVKQGSALLLGVEAVKHLDDLKAQALAELKALLGRQDWTSDEERVAALVRGFEFGARLKQALSDELMDTPGYNEVTEQLYAIWRSLDAIGHGRRLALARLLDHPNAGVRATAATVLIKLIPDRVLPILREIERTTRSNSAYFEANWTRLRWETDGT